MATERGNARKNKQDEFYTQLVDVENECRHYKEQFYGKTIFCNCDDPFESNFFKYFAMNFNHLGLKKLICTCYATSPVAWEQLSLFDNANVVLKVKDGKQPYKIEISEVLDYNGDGAVDLADVEYLLKNEKNTLSVLEGDGDFRSEECVELLKQADIVVTNPPFSLFREYVAQLVEYDKKFLIIGNQNAVAYKEIFPLLRNEKVWLGYNSGSQEFQVPNDFDKKNVYVNEKGLKMAKFGNICWFTNLDISKRHEMMPLYKKYTPEEYPTYYKYDAINVKRVSEIPCNYYGKMGVPITFLDNYNPEQFEIIGLGAGDLGREVGIGEGYTEEELKKFKKMNPAFRRGIPFYFDNEKLVVPYARILIRRRKTDEN